MFGNCWQISVVNVFYKTNQKAVSDKVKITNTDIEIFLFYVSLDYEKHGFPKNKTSMPNAVESGEL